MDRRFDSLGPSGRVDKVIDNILKHKFLEPFPIDNDEGNGLLFNNVYFPEEVVTKILTFVNPAHILQKALVCKRWCNIITSSHYWVQIYERKHRRTPKSLPWYVFYCYFGRRLLNCNLIKNGNGQEGLCHWDITNAELRPFAVDWDPPLGTDPLPPHVPDFNGYSMCLVTNGEVCLKNQDVDLFDSKLLFYIVNRYCPDIYLSDWVAVRFDCSATYTLTGTIHQKSFTRFTATTRHDVALGEGRVWKKIELVIQDYSDYIVDLISYQREGISSRNVYGLYGIKMAGGVVKILMDSINIDG